MKKVYFEPKLILVPLESEDILTASGDNDAPFVSVGKGTWIDDGWSGYY